MELCWRTKNGDPPKKKPKVYISYCGRDMQRYGEKLIGQLHEICDCAVYYHPSATQLSIDEAYRFDLERMDLMVIPVTAELLCKPNRTMDHDVAFAQQHHIPILPLLQEDRLEGIYNHRFGNLQYLQEGNSDRTAIPYKEKLEKFLTSVLVGNQLADEVRKAFYARIFLSYRKKDRALAQQLMALIHEDPQLRDVAIWYDEFLTPGDNFEKNIGKELEGSDLFLLAVTPNLLEPSNYVMTTEYPKARGVLPVLPAQLAPTDLEQLKKCYRGISDPVDAYDSTARSGHLQQLLQGKLRQTADPYHSYLMGVAYLTGIDVERNPQRAIALLTEAAENGIPAAARKLAFAYHMGDRVPHDHKEATRWVKRFVELKKEPFDRSGDEESTLEFFRALQTAVRICGGNMDHSAAKLFALQGIPVAQRLCRDYDFSTQLLSESYRQAGQVFSDCDDHEKAFQYQKQAVELDEARYESDRNMDVRRQMVDSYCQLAETCEELEQLQEAAEYYGKAEQILQVMTKVRKDPNLVRELMDLYGKLSGILNNLGDKRQARHYAKQADGAFRSYKHQLEQGGLFAWMSAASYYTNRRKVGKAIRMMEKATLLAKEAEDSDSFDDRNLLALAYTMLGTLWEIKERPKKAGAYYLLAAEIFRQLAEAYPCPQTHYELVDSYESLGSTYDRSYIWGPEEVFYSDFSLPKRDRQSVESAFSYYQKALELLEQVESDQTEYGRRKADLLEAVGRLHKALGRKQEAIRCYREYRQLCRQLFEAFRTDISADRYAESCFRLAMMTLERDLMEEAYRIWEKLSRRNPNYLKRKKEALRLLNL